jgi:hypothetical protein
VAGQEGHPPAPHVADGDGRRRRPVGRVEGDLDGVIEERVEAGAAENADLGPGPRGHAILLSFFDESLLLLLLLLEEDDDESEEDEELDEDAEVVSFSLVLRDPPFPPRLSVL